MAASGEDDIKVVDRRLFDSEGNLRGEESRAAEPAAVPSSAPSATRPAPAAPVEGEKPPGASRPARRSEPAQGAPAEGVLPEGAPDDVNFAAFVMSLAFNALAALGEMTHPSQPAPVVDLAAARQLIDILAMLREKTEGNRSPEESAILDGNLYELRMKYVEKMKSSA